jgi:hypothetical protein
VRKRIKTFLNNNNGIDIKKKSPIQPFSDKEVSQFRFPGPEISHSFFLYKRESASKNRRRVVSKQRGEDEKVKGEEKEENVQKKRKLP